MQRLKMIVAYDGASFSGWQSQANGNTIQDHLERAFAGVSGMDVRVHGSGRTDAGVHALAQTAHADVPQSRLTPERWLSALNASLPPQIRVLVCRRVARTFHARFSAKGKVYRYRIWNAAVLPPFERDRAWHISSELDVRVIERTARVFVGRHDFAGFAANRGAPPRETVRTIRSAKVCCVGDCITIEFEGDGFLYKMVRLMAGAQIRCALGKDSAVQIATNLASPKKNHARLVAPAQGLYLVRVRY